ncbi:MAG: fumarate hydratase [Eubacteriales bacterium]|mgnify:CR=1 FL=1|nr:fumarate hydratase [Clostridiales bacterium]MDY3308964.1 fumarate hydratase [Eubacteriales bacterium]MDD7488691.1 fumarate hydratase [Clostridiales bacterium]MDD7522522.1 fumarate hydratase [Clostridiales bacterium]MDD7688842.1 fumarate hydratase [Clostridiales bacterium]
MRTIHASLLTDTIASLCVEANCRLPEDMRRSIENARNEEKWDTARGILDKIIENYNIADEKFVPICQDTGVCCVFLKIGTDVHIEGDLIEAVNEGVRRGYRDGYLRKSVVGDPLRRVNTGDNTPAMLYTELVPGDKLELTVAPKGFGSENMSKLAMLKPSDGVEGVKDFVVKTVEEAGPNPCPPIVVGVGIGGTFDKAALLAKKALMRSTDERNKDEYYAALEAELLDRINALGIGPQGFGGRTTALAVNIETMPTHIAGLPVAVNINCHVTRHRTVIL